MNTTTTNPDFSTRTTTKPHRRAARMVVAAVLMAAVGVAATAGSAGAATGRTGVHHRSAATCQGISPVMASQSRIRVEAPTMFAANTSSAVDGQIVRFRQRLLRWNGTAWVSTGQASAVWSGFATDSKAALDFSDGRRTLRRPAITFTTGPGYFAVVTDYWFAATNRTAGGSNMAVAKHAPSPNTTYCGFQH